MPPRVQESPRRNPKEPQILENPGTQVILPDSSSFRFFACDETQGRRLPRSWPQVFPEASGGLSDDIVGGGDDDVHSESIRAIVSTLE